VTAWWEDSRWQAGFADCIEHGVGRPWFSARSPSARSAGDSRSNELDESSRASRRLGVDTGRTRPGGGATSPQFPSRPWLWLNSTRPAKSQSAAHRDRMNLQWQGPRCEPECYPKIDKAFLIAKPMRKALSIVVVSVPGICTEGFRVNPTIFRERARARKARLQRRLDRDNFPDGDRPVMRASNIHYELADRTLATNYGGIGLMEQETGISPRRSPRWAGWSTVKSRPLGLPACRTYRFRTGTMARHPLPSTLISSGSCLRIGRMPACSPPNG